MLASSIPYKFQFAWGAGATQPQYLTVPIPATSVGAAAGQDLGFPPATATDPAAGGTPPNINDVNGALYYETSWSRWVQAGGPVSYDSTFSTDIGGYPKGAVISAASLGGFWLSTADNNISDPDTGGANWSSFSAVHGAQTYATPGTYTLVVPAGVTRVFAQVWGGGGGAGSGTVAGASGSGAGGGGYSEKLCTVSPGDSIPVTVGGAGTGSSGAFNGTAGGSSSFGSFNSATGGGFGSYSAGGGQATVGGAGVGSGGDLNETGQTGGTGSVPLAGTGQGGGGGGAFCTSSTGASFATGGQGASPGGGGGGGANSNNGGAGGNGLVIVRW